MCLKPILVQAYNKFMEKSINSFQESTDTRLDLSKGRQFIFNNPWKYNKNLRYSTPK